MTAPQDSQTSEGCSREHPFGAGDARRVRLWRLDRFGLVTSGLARILLAVERQDAGDRCKDP